MTERSVILREHEVKGILENRLSLLVRPVKLNIRHRDKFAGFGSPGYRVGDHWYSETEVIEKCPLGAPGDRLWGRETWAIDRSLNPLTPSMVTTPQEGSTFALPYFKADGMSPWKPEMGTPGGHMGCGKWRPSTQMPKWAARIWLENAGVRVARVQDISEEDAVCMGCLTNDQYADLGGSFEHELPVVCPYCRGGGNVGAVGENLGYMEVTCDQCDTPTKRLSILWNKRNPRYPWDSNPWVWLVGTKTLSTNGRPE